MIARLMLAGACAGMALSYFALALVEPDVATSVAVGYIALLVTFVVAADLLKRRHH